jgi:hypothetical protein
LNTGNKATFLINSSVGDDMINRTFKFYAQAFSNTGPVSVVAKFNGQQIYSGPIPTTNTPVPQQPGDQNIIAFEYTGPTDIQGQIPFELTATGGIVCFGRIEANYSGFDINIDDTDPDNSIMTVAIAPEDYWGDVNYNSVETDGKINVRIDGVEQIRQVIDPEQTGDWWYRISDSQTLTCDIFVDPDLIVTRAPTIEELAANNQENTD